MVDQGADLVVPAKLRRQAGIRKTDKIQFEVSRRKITILATPESEYTPSERRAINARLAKARKGPYHGPFADADEAMNFVDNEIKRRNKNKNTGG